MTIETALGCAGLMAAGALTPGPNNSILLATGMTHGFRRAAPQVLAIAVGTVLLVAAAGLGVGAVLTRFPAASDVLRVIGAAYMLYLAWVIARTRFTEPGDAARRALGPIRVFVFQFVNPKGWILATTVITAFADRESPLADVLPLALLTGAVAMVCALIWAIGGVGLHRLATRPRVFRAIHLVLAGVVVLTAVLLLLEPLLVAGKDPAA